jgi:hypothetical protein
MLSAFLDRLIAFSARDSASLMAARTEWWERAGKVLDDDPLYEERSTAFLEWFALDRPGVDGRRPVERFLAEGRLDDLEGSWASSCQRSHRSMFRIEALRPGELDILDLLGGARFRVAERRMLPGLERGDLFEARLVANVVDPPMLLFSRAFQFHPREAHGPVTRLCREAHARKEAREETLFRLARLRLKVTRYRHVSAARIYEGAEPA